MVALLLWLFLLLFCWPLAIAALLLYPLVWLLLLPFRPLSRHLAAVYSPAAAPAQSGTTS
jgi:hypothetical protein